MFGFKKIKKLLKLNLFVTIGRIVECLHDLGRDNSVIDVRGEFLAGLDAVDKGVDLVLKVIVGFDFRSIADKGAVLCGIEGKVFAILQTDAGFITDEVDVHLTNTDILCPGAMDIDNGAGGADQTGNGVVNIINAIGLRGACPHIFVGVFANIFAQFAESLAADCEGSGIAAAIHNDIEEMDTPVDESTAAGNGLCGEGAAQTRNGAMSAERDIDVVNFAQLTGINVFFDQVDIVVETVDNTDIQNLPVSCCAFCISSASA